MSKNNIYITYLYNSGFIAETEKHLMIFDFCLGVSDVNTINMLLYLLVMHIETILIP